MKKQRILIVLIPIVVFILIPLVIWIIQMNSQVHTGARFIVVPDNLLVKDGETQKVVNYEDVVEYTPGEHTLKLSSDGFASQEYKVTIKKGEVQDIYLVLEAQSDSAKEYMSEPEIQSRIERVGGFQINQGAAEIEKKYPFVTKLPIIEKNYTVYPCVAEGTTGKDVFAACITLLIDNDFNRKAALQSLRDKDIDLTKIKYQFSSQE